MYNTAKSEKYSVTSGIGQGSSLGPLLFLITINDLPEYIKHSMILMFADDVKLAMSIQNPSDVSKLQIDIDSVYRWGVINSLHPNSIKCAVMTYSRTSQTIARSYTLNGQNLQNVNSIRDLGTCFDTEITFNQNVLQICKKSRKALGFVVRQSKYFHNHQVITLLYNAFVRSLLENNYIFWCPHEKKYVLLIEKIQKPFVRYLYWKQHGYYPYMYPTQFVLGMVGHQSIEVRRHLAIIKYFLRLIRGSITNPWLLQYVTFKVPTPFVRTTLRPRPTPLFTIPSTNTVTLVTSPLYAALNHINNILLFDPQTDIFSQKEPRLLATATRYLESISIPSTTPS